MYKFFALLLLGCVALNAADKNLLVNSNFSKISRGKPIGWILIDGNKKWGKQGTIGLAPSELRKNGKMLLINRTATDGYYPQLRSGLVKVKPGVYTAKLWVKCPHQWVFRYFLSASGKQKKERKPGINFRPFNNFQEAVVTIKVPKGYDRLAIGAYTQAKTQLMQYFAGEITTFHLPLAPQGTPFRQQTWQALQQIPYGETRCYSEQAELMNNKKAVRAVGAANGANPIAIIIPCHRVIGKNGSLTGYAGGLHRKEWLLNFEQLNCEQTQQQHNQAIELANK